MKGQVCDESFIKGQCGAIDRYMDRKYNSSIAVEHAF